jgi:hypothetical protein
MYSVNRNKAECLTGLSPGYISSKKIARNTVKVQYPNGTIIIRYMNTNVVTINPDKSIVLNSGGYMTVTTKARIEENTKIRIAQRNNIWYIIRNIHEYPNRSDFEALPLFYDGITISDDGKILSGLKVVPDAIIKQFKKDLKKLCDKITKDNVPLPDSGDCFICRFDLASKKATSDHLISHVKECYMHGSLIWLCLELSGFNPGLHFQMRFIDTMKRSVRNVITSTCIPVLLKNPEIYAKEE